MEVNGSSFHIEASGDGKAFIWGHGLMSSIASEGNRFLQFDRLAQFSRIVRYDAKGHGLSGASDNPSDYRWEQLGTDMLDIADALGIEQFVAGGASMGCATSLYAALQAPYRVQGLVLVIPPTAWETRAAKANLYEDMASFIERHGPEQLRAMLASAPEHWSSLSTLENRVATLRNMYTALPTVLRGAKLSNLPGKEVLTQLRMPALILCWTDDPGHPVSTAQELLQLLPNARLSTASTLEELSTWTSQVEDFLKTI